MQLMISGNQLNNGWPFSSWFFNQHYDERVVNTYPFCAMCIYKKIYVFSPLPEFEIFTDSSCQIFGSRKLRSMTGIKKLWRTRNCKIFYNQAEPQLSAVKVILMVFWKFKDILLIEVFHDCHTVNAIYYSQLLNKVKLAYWQKKM